MTRIKLRIPPSILFALAIALPVYGQDRAWDGVVGEPPPQASLAPSEAVSADEEEARRRCCIQIDFEDADHGECINDKYAELGVFFTRDDGGCVFAYDWRSTGYETCSAPMVLAASAGPGTPEPASAVNVIVPGRGYRIAALLGNDGPDRPRFEARVQGPIGSGSHSGPSNGNMHVDDFRMTGMDPPFLVGRFSRNDTGYALVLDNLYINECSLGKVYCIEPGEGHPCGEGTPESLEATLPSAR